MNEEQKIRKTLESLTDALDYLELLRINRAHAIQNKQPGIVLHYSIERSSITSLRFIKYLVSFKNIHEHYTLQCV